MFVRFMESPSFSLIFALKAIALGTGSPKAGRAAAYLYGGGAYEIVLCCTLDSFTFNTHFNTPLEIRKSDAKIVNLL